MKLKQFIPPLLLGLLGFSSKSVPKTIPSSTGTLTIIISNFRNNEGKASVALFNQEEAFPKLQEKAVGILYVPINNKKSVAVFENLPDGEYAVSVFHDENNNKKMDTNFFGIPKEGVGASNNARGHFGPPKYHDAKFIFNGNMQTLTIDIVYL
jgi:uncharacterized protein (DUF2141 family)